MTNLNSLNCLKLMKEITAKQVRWKLTDVLDEANRDKMRFRITKNGRPVAVLLGSRDFDELTSLPATPVQTPPPLVKDVLEEPDGEKELLVERSTLT